jgi:gliding motility-associated protein GldE
VSAFFSGSETAFFSLSRADTESLKKKSGAKGTLSKLLNKPKRLLITILTGNTIVNIAAASLAAVLVRDLCRQGHFSETLGLVLEIAVVSFLILLLGEITPKFVALKNAAAVSQRVSSPIRGFQVILTPLIWLFSGITNLVSRTLGLGQQRLFISEDEIKTLVEVGQEHGELEAEEKEMITSIFEFGDTAIREVMVPRMDMVAVEENTNLDEVVNLIRDHGHSRIPVYRERIDNIVGILYAKDLLPHLGRRQDEKLTDLVREAIFVPESKKIDEMLKEFQREKVHMAIVVDEYGGTAGLVTLEDILEEIVGEIQDEFDTELPLWQKLDDRTYEVEARIGLDELNEIMGKEAFPPSEDYDTLGGFIFHLTGNVPETGETLEYGKYHLTVKDVTNRRVGRVRITQIPPAEEKSRNHES